MTRSAYVAALAARLSDYDSLVEVGIGRRPDVAASLAEQGRSVTATDIHERPAPDGVDFVLDDVFDPDSTVYADTDAIYALNLPPELHRPAADLARTVGADLLFTTLGSDQPQISVNRESLPVGMLYVANTGSPGRE